MEINGIDLDGLAAHTNEITFPATVPGRTVHIDADFLAYQCSADSKGEKTFDDMQHNAAIAVDTLRSLAAAERVHLHLTPKGSNKGGRYDIAIQREYQGNRRDKEKPRYLDLMRDHLAQTFPASLHMDCEADDGMSAAQYAAISGGSHAQSIIASKDKDLRMVPGFQLDWELGSIHFTDPSEPFGSVELVSRKTPSGAEIKKLKGYGQKMFWAQMLTGDTADNIQGLPKICGPVLNKIDPTAKTQKLSAIAMGPDGPKKQAAIRELSERAKACGPGLAYKVLSRLNTNRACFDAVKALYRCYGETIGFQHWHTGESVPWQQVFMSEAKLLWMRKNGADANCVIHWFKEIATQ